jgi:phospholipid/cholesterol/gamma-HCH transport system substrate-binding protein
VGSVSEIKVMGSHAELTLDIRETYQMPVDTTAELRSAGIIGDRMVFLYLGNQPKMLKDEDWIELKEQPIDYDNIARQVDAITEDVAVITDVMRTMAEDDTNKEDIEATIANVRAMSEALRATAERNQDDVDQIVRSVERLARMLEGVAADNRDDVDEEMQKIKEATDRLNRTLGDVESVAGKIDDGAGSIGALVNDRTTVDLVNETIENANSVVEGFSGMKTEVYYIGRLYQGTVPEDPQFFDGNPLAPWGGSNTIGLNLMPQEDFWYNFEINDYVTGTVTYVEHYFPDTGEHFTEYIREPNYRFTFQMNKRFYSFALRLGVKENGGGVGASYFLFDDRLELQGDVFDFDLGSYPATDSSGIPNLRLTAHGEPIDRVYLEVGMEQILLGARYGYVSGFFGIGFHFSDDDVKLLFATLPMSF